MRHLAGAGLQPTHSALAQLAGIVGLQANTLGFADTIFDAGALAHYATALHRGSPARSPWIGRPSKASWQSWKTIWEHGSSTPARLHVFVAATAKATSVRESGIARLRPVKRTYHHKDLRNALIDETLRALSEGGLGTLTLRELARRLGVTHAAPYAHFADKRALLEAVAEIGFNRLTVELQSARERASEPGAALVELARAYMRFATEQPELYRLMFAAPELGAQHCEPLRHAGERAFDVLAGVIARFDAAWDEERIHDAAFSAWALVHGTAMLVIDARAETKSDRTPDEIARIASELLVRGLGRGERPHS
ncbi:MAG: TetR/AcrR family transcriptional regulator [Vulcanimicrobiaceae bacterium]